MVVTDAFIDGLFADANFGASINNSSEEKKKFIRKTLRNQIEGYWSGHTAYHLAVDGGFLKDAKSGAEKKLTAFGVSFLNE